MSTATAIQWTDVTDNIIVVDGGGWWCRMISEGCVFCYAAKLNQRSFFGGNKLPYSGEAPQMVLRREVCDGWAKQTKPKRHFVASMTDVFGEWVTQNQVDYFLYSMLAAPKQTFQILTKRPGVAKHRIDIWLDGAGLVRLPDNIWIGVSAENQKRADERLPILKSIPARVRFVSYEPALERVDFNLMDDYEGDPQAATRSLHSGWLSWMILGGESGQNARHCATDWIHDGVKQCRAAGARVFVKQLGSRAVCENKRSQSNAQYCRVPLKHPKGGDPLEWPQDLRVREFPGV